ncbi:MAG: tRNA threonylcarbamoyladenosine dehydratase [Chlorobi bacterium]|nr:tRNA threonylcarbamoyladenosine dehydratase [Chlorobiota bacterium]
MSDIPPFLSRMEPLFSPEAITRLGRARVLVAGLGGVGSHAAEALARAGVGKLTLVDGDRVEITNINRQLPALHSTVGRLKTEVMRERLSDIHPSLQIETVPRFLEPDQWEELLDATSYDYVVDAIDTLSPKIHLIRAALERKIPLVSAMGSGGKIDPSRVRVVDISQTRDDYLARMVRKRLHKAGIRSGFKAVFSDERPPKSAVVPVPDGEFKKSAYGTVSYMPALFGLLAAAEVIRDLTREFFSRKED